MSFLWIFPAALVVGLVLVLVTLPRTPKTRAPAAEMTPEQARAIAQAFCSAMDGHPLLVDAANLPYPKEQIDRALLQCIRLEADEHARSAFAVLYVALAHWQPNAGDGSRAAQLAADLRLMEDADLDKTAAEFIASAKEDSRLLGAVAKERVSRSERLRVLETSRPATIPPRAANDRAPSRPAEPFAQKRAGSSAPQTR